MKEEFVPFELAKKLKEKGFEFGTFHHYNEDGTINAILPEPLENKPLIPCPTIAQVLKWLRNEQDIHIQVELWTQGWYSGVLLFEHCEGDNEYSSKLEFKSLDYKSYEQAAIAGITYIVYNLL